MRKARVIKVESCSRRAAWLMVLLLSTLAAGCGDGGREGVLGSVAAPVGPRVTAVTPIDHASGVVTSTAIVATFTQDMAPTTISAATFTVTCVAPCISPTGSVTYVASSKEAVFTPTVVLAPGVIYTATISAAATDLAGSALAGNQAPLPAASAYIWSFTTGGAPDTTRPRVTFTDPATTSPGPTTGVVTNTAIAATFTEDMAPATINAASFTVKCVAPASCISPAGTVTYVANSRAAVFTPTTGLAPSTTYIATITSAAMDPAGNALAGNQAALPAASDYVWTFTTGTTLDTTRPRVTLTDPATTDPGPTTGVPANTAIVATFTEDMDPATINAATFTVSCAAPCVSPAGNVSYALGTQAAVFTPTAALVAGTTYTATITAKATDLSGNALAGNQAPLPAASAYVWTFTTTTAMLAAPVSVLSTSPTAAQSGVCPDATVSATFSVPSGTRINPTTVNTTTFTLTGPAPAVTSVTAASVVLDSATGRIATFTPQSALTAGGTYTALILGGAPGIHDLAVPPNAMASNFTWSFTAGPATGSCLAPVALGSVAPFGTFGGLAGMTNTGTRTVINGDIGTIATGTSSITGFNDTAGDVYTETPANIGLVNGTIYTCTTSTTGPTSTAENPAYCASAKQARLDAQSAYLAMVNLPTGANKGGNLGGLTLAPGVYTAPAGTYLIQGGDLTLDAQGNANAVWVFQMATTLTVGGPGAAFPQSVILANGAQAKNVFWQVGSNATINAGGGGTMVGTIISQAGAEFSTVGNVDIVTLNGRVLSLGASVTLVDTVINVPAP
jgi:Ice-binding-like/Bacterial Ig-like domain